MNTGSWQPDPTQRHQFRFWDGTAWTDHVSDNGVVGSDPIALPSAPHPTWTPPTAPIQAMPVPPAADTAASRSRNQPWAIMIGVGALVAAGVFAIVSLQGDEPSTTPSTAVATTSTLVGPTTTVPPETTSSPTTIAAVIDAATLIAAMPTDAEVPADWSRYSEPFERTDTGVGLCRGPSGATLAIQSGSAAVVAGPRWDLPNDGWFGIEMALFPTAAEASNYLLAEGAQASSCTTNPAVWEESEADLDHFAGDFAIDAIWQQTEVAMVGEEATVNGDEDLRVVQERRSTVTYDVAYSQVVRWIYTAERHGRVVITFWIGGQWGESGWSSFSGAYQPTDADLDAAADVVRVGVIARLEEAGAF